MSLGFKRLKGFGREKNRDYAACLKYAVLIFVE